MRVSLGQVARIGFAATLVLIISFIYLPHLFYTYSITAIVSAPVISVTSPIDGVLKDSPPVMGTEMKSGDLIGVVENPRFDRKGLDDMITEMQGIQEKISAMREEKNKLEAVKVDLIKSYKSYTDSLKERLKIDIERAKENLKKDSDTISESKAAFLRKSKLYKKGVVAENQADSAYFNAERATKSGEQSKLDIERLQAQLSALESGIFINVDGRTEVPYQEQRIHEVRMRQHDLDTKIREFTIREASLKRSVDLEEARYEKMSKATIKSPFLSVVWRVFGSKGNHVDTTRPILELVDCSNVFVDTSIHERYFNKVKPGDAATIRLVGDSRTLKGKVLKVRGGSLSESSTAFLAGATQVLRPHEMQVMIGVDAKEIEKHGTTGDFCFMGRTGEVSFDKIGIF
ncbi:MAG: HlyD family efflux transporter periplasmic adaptor subunit [Alphaproteobacteria bacterium]|nr:HlyD family efflux transporter periplasmic adaptor subunit [Alphaproteobacteria bacterium]